MTRRPPPAQHNTPTATRTSRTSRSTIAPSQANRFSRTRPTSSPPPPQSRRSPTTTVSPASHHYSPATAPPQSLLPPSIPNARPSQGQHRPRPTIAHATRTTPTTQQTQQPSTDSLPGPRRRASSTPPRQSNIIHHAYARPENPCETTPRERDDNGRTERRP